VPPDRGGRAFVIITGVLLLNAALFATVSLCFSLSGGRPFWFRLVVDPAIGLSLVLAQLTWLLFLRAVAIELDDAKLSGRIRTYAVVFSVWAGVNVAAVWTSVVMRHNLVGGPVWALNVLLFFMHYLGVMVLSGATAALVEHRLKIHGQAKSSDSDASATRLAITFEDDTRD
jgi:hypothetical protein